MIETVYAGYIENQAGNTVKLVISSSREGFLEVANELAEDNPAPVQVFGPYAETTDHLAHEVLSPEHLATFYAVVESTEPFTLVYGEDQLKRREGYAQRRTSRLSTPNSRWEVSNMDRLQMQSKIFDYALNRIFGPHSEPVWCESEGCNNQADGQFLNGEWVPGTAEELEAARDAGRRGFYCNDCAGGLK